MKIDIDMNYGNCLKTRIFRLRYLIIGLLVAGLGLFTSSIPYSQNLVTLYCQGFFSGFCGGALDAGLIFQLINCFWGAVNWHTIYLSRGRCFSIFNRINYVNFFPCLFFINLQRNLKRISYGFLLIQRFKRYFCESKIWGLV